MDEDYDMLPPHLQLCWSRRTLRQANLGIINNTISEYPKEHRYLTTTEGWWGPIAIAFAIRFSAFWMVWKNTSYFSFLSHSSYLLRTSSARRAKDWGDLKEGFPKSPGRATKFCCEKRLTELKNLSGATEIVDRTSIYSLWMRFDCISATCFWNHCTTATWAKLKLGFASIAHHLTQWRRHLFKLFHMKF